jgi:hypothetical protein
MHDQAQHAGTADLAGSETFGIHRCERAERAIWRATASVDRAGATVVPN